MTTDKIDLTKPVRHRATKKPVEVRECFAVDGMGKSTLVMYPGDFETNYENAPQLFEFDMRPRNGFRIRSMGEYQFLRVNTALMGRGEIDLDIFDVRAIYRNIGLWLDSRDDGGVKGEPIATTETHVRAEFADRNPSNPRRIRIGCLEFYCHLRDFMAGGPLVYVSKIPFGPGQRGPVRIAKLYGGAIRTLRDWCNAMLGEVP